MTYVIYFGLQNIAHWMFSFEYYKMVRIIPFVLDDKTLPQSILKENTVQFWVFIVLNTICAILLGVTYYF